MSDPPRRLQRSRAAGAHLPAGTVCVGRPSRWNNPYRIERRLDGRGWLTRGPDGLYTCCSSQRQAQEVAVEMYRCAVLGDLDYRAAARAELAGKDLACWCHLCDKHRETGLPLGEVCMDCEPCHADALLRVANEEAT